MYYVVAYDICTQTREGRRRLRRVAKICKGYGIRVQHSVFECKLERAEFEQMRHRLLARIDPDTDSIRLYRIPEPHQDHIEEYGIGKPVDLDEPLIV